MHNRSLFTITSLVVAPAMAAGLAMTAPASADLVVFDSQHFDLELGFKSDLRQWDIHWHLHDTAPGEEDEFEPEDVRVLGRFFSTDVAPFFFDHPVPRPSGSAWDFTGAAPGQNLYVFPANDPGGLLPYIGIAAEEVAQGVFQNNRVTLTFKGIESGPADGHFSLYSFAGANPVAIFSSADSGLANALNVNAGSHVHHNWAFSQLGDYTLVFEASGTLADGTFVRSGDFELNFTVIPEPASVAVLGLAGLTLLRRRR